MATPPDRMDMAIHEVLARSRCPRCGGRLQLHHVLTKQQFVALIETRCLACQRTAKTLCFDSEALRSMRHELEKGAFPGAVPASPEPRSPTPSEPTPITTDDVTRIVDFLGSFDGDFRRLFAGRSDDH